MCASTVTVVIFLWSLIKYILAFLSHYEWSLLPIPVGFSLGFVLAWSMQCQIYTCLCLPLWVEYTTLPWGVFPCSCAYVEHGMSAVLWGEDWHSAVRFSLPFSAWLGEECSQTAVEQNWTQHWAQSQVLLKVRLKLSRPHPAPSAKPWLLCSPMSMRIKLFVVSHWVLPSLQMLF